MKGRIRDWLRYPRTQQERRRAFADDPNTFRPARGMMALPTAWDDQWRHVQRTWKAFRKTRWK